MENETYLKDLIESIIKMQLVFDHGLQEIEDLEYKIMQHNNGGAPRETPFDDKLSDVKNVIINEMYCTVDLWYNWVIKLKESDSFYVQSYVDNINNCIQEINANVTSNPKVPIFFEIFSRMKSSLILESEMDYDNRLLFLDLI